MPAERKYGQDNEYYQWSPIVTRPKLEWPNNARVALCVVVDLEHYDWYMPPDAPVPLGPPGGGRGFGFGRFPDIMSFSHHEYGNRVGIFRVLKVLDKYGIKPTIAMDSTAAKNYPFVVRECQKYGAEFIAHGSTVRHLIHAGMSEDEERAYIHESIEALSKATGQQPVGWLSPEFNETMRTPNILASEGIRYVCDWANDEQPYKMNVQQGEMFSLSVHLDLDDIFTHRSRNVPIMEYSEIARETFDELYRSGVENGRMLVLNIHPWLIGQPFRIKYLDEMLAHMTKFGGVWKATGQEIIDWYKAQS
jgi:allantoinase